MLATAEKFRMYIRDVTPSANPDGIPLSKRLRQQHVLRCGLLWLIDYAASETAMSASQRLRFIRDISNPEVESQTQRWAEQFEGRSEEHKAGSQPLTLFYALAGDLCAMCASAPQGDSATATDGNGDVQLDEVA